MGRPQKNPEQKYLKADLISSEKYGAQHDLLCALLSDGQSYTFDEVDAAIEKYLKGRA